jgi:putative flippase GtrA
VVKLGSRWLKFNAVGLMGVGVQLAALWLYTSVLGWHYLVSTALAVETAVLHNYVWHMAWTWRDRADDGASNGSRLMRFHLGNGLVSLLANLALMRLFAGVFHVPLLAANVISITLTSILNFAIGEFWVFARPR